MGSAKLLKLKRSPQREVFTYSKLADVSEGAFMADRKRFISNEEKRFAAFKSVLNVHQISGSLEDFRACLNKYIDPLTFSSHCKQLMQYTAAYKNENLLTVVLEKYGQPWNINSCDKEGKTLLMTAVSNRNSIHTALLLNLGVSVFARDHNAYTALHHAARKPEVAIMKLLFKHGAEANARDYDRVTPFMIACSSTSNIDIIQLFLSYGADPHAEDLKSRNALIYARRMNCTNGILKALEEAESITPDIIYPIVDANIDAEPAEPHNGFTFLPDMDEEDIDTEDFVHE